MKDDIEDSAQLFLSYIKNRAINNYINKKSAISDILSIISGYIDKFVATISFISSDNKFIEEYFLFSTLDQTINTKFDINYDAANTNHPYQIIVTGNSLKYIETERIPFKGNMTKDNLIKAGLTNTIIVPITFKEHKNWGFLTIFVSSESASENIDYIFEMCSKIAKTLKELIFAWYENFVLNDSVNKLNIIKTFVNSSQGTTKLNVILRSVFNDIISRTRVDGIGFFNLNKNEIKFFYGINIEKDVVYYFESFKEDISKLPFYNIQYQTDKLFDKQHLRSYFIIPVKSTNLTLGFLFIISKPNQSFCKSTEDLLRTLSKQIFVQLQREFLLEDIQAITQTSELVFFPVIVLNKQRKVLYVNNKFEESVHLTHEQCIGTEIDSILNIEAKYLQQLRRTISEVIETTRKKTITIPIKYSENRNEETGHIFLCHLSPTINNLTGEYCVVLSLVDITESFNLQKLKDEYNKRLRLYQNILLHDMFDILFAIGGYYELAQREHDDEELYNKISQKIISLVDEGTDTIANIRLLSRVLDIGYEKEKIVLPLKTSLSEASNKVIHEISEREVIIRNNIPPTIKVIGGKFVNYFFHHIIYNITKLVNNNILEIEFMGEKEKINDKKQYRLTILTKGEIAPNKIAHLEDIVKTPKLDFNTKKLLWVEVIKLIAKENDFQVDIQPILNSKNKVEGIKIIVIMPLK